MMSEGSGMGGPLWVRDRDTWVLPGAWLLLVCQVGTCLKGVAWFVCSQGGWVYLVTQGMG